MNPEKTLKPEEKARLKIDRWLEAAGWQVVDRCDYESTMQAVAVREALLQGNREADYFLFIEGVAVAILEAKREDADITAQVVSDQVEAYARSVPKHYKAFRRPIPILYKSNGRHHYYCDFRNNNSSNNNNANNSNRNNNNSSTATSASNADTTYHPLTRMHTVYDLVRMLGIESLFAGLPTLSPRGLRQCQYQAIRTLEQSFRQGNKRALMVLATGAGKTYTACMAAYRLLAHTPMRRVLFLVDRNNLGRQAETGFATFRLTENGDPFNTIYPVNRLCSPSLPADSNVVITTIHRLFSMLNGSDITDSDDDDLNPTPNGEQPVAMPSKPTLPPNFFDLIIIDEWHRSIYGTWRQVLDYFSSAHMIGLTATPVKETVAFFNNNIVANYSLEQSVADGVNVDHRIYRIKTQATESGGAILEGSVTSRQTRYNGQTQEVRCTADRHYTAAELNRSVVNPSQIKLILETYRDAVYTEMFCDPQREPNMDYLPKTLIFALNEAHATNIVTIAKEVFHRTDDHFVQKITYSAHDSNQLIREFCNDRNFRIAVTCTLVATGTDVPPLEVVMFMRDVESNQLYQQMKGRGVRTISDEALRLVTPNAISKDLFFIVDAVGVTEHSHSDSAPVLEPKDTPLSLKELLERIAHGYLPDAYLRQLAASLARLNRKAEPQQQEHFRSLAGIDMHSLSANIYTALTDDSLSEFISIDNPNTERRNLVAPVANNAPVRHYILLLAAGFVDTLMPGEDTLISKGFSLEEAKTTTASFANYCHQHRDDIEALRIIYNSDTTPLSLAMLRDLEQKLLIANARFTRRQLWNCYSLLAPDTVRRPSIKDEAEALTNIIHLVRYAYKQTTRLESSVATAKQYFNLWLGQAQHDISPQQRSVIATVVDYIAFNGACTINDLRQNNDIQAAQLITAYRTPQAANAALMSLYRFVVLRAAS